MSEIKLSGTTVINNTGGAVTVDANQLQIGSTTVIDNNKKLSNVDIVPNSSFMFRNKVINGDMRINQRGDVTLTTDDQSTYTGVDRFKINGNPPSARGTIKRTADAPEGLAYCLELDVTQNGTPTSTYFGNITQIIEGQNLSDLNWGTTNAKSVTLSFWVKTNISGGANGFTISLSTDTANDRSIHKTYKVNQANTWEKKSITFPGDTSNAIPNTNTIGLQVSWCHSAFSDRQTSTADTWKAGNRGYALQNAAPNFWSSTDNYFKITGVQLEIGTVATPFEHRPIGMELSLCQRYFCKTGQNIFIGRGNSNSAVFGVTLPVSMRSTPTITITNGNIVVYDHDSHESSSTDTVTVNSSTTTDGFGFRCHVSGVTAPNNRVHAIESESTMTFSSEL
tara:strand:+ start:169 stop:1350 length:1182 start_codon:yes stop_codon:yes gene_type:complete